MRKLISALTNRVTIVGIMFLLQIGTIVWLVNTYAADWYYLHLGSMILGFLLTLHLIVQDENPMYKLLWIILLLLIPLFGTLFYLYARTERLSFSSSSRMIKAQEARAYELTKIKSKFHDQYLKHQQYLDQLNFPTYTNTESVFLPSGNMKQKILLEELRKARFFIFMEYFIITKSKMWNEILEVLIEKRRQGVEVSIIYDDFGSATKLPFNYHKKLRKLGFKVVRFNPMKLHLNFSMNYRNHRKIVVIDNKVAFTGGINIGDEYTNKKKVFGYWNDAGIMIKGDAVWTFTVLFLENWMFSAKEQIEFQPYKLKNDIQNDKQYIPFGDIPVDQHLTAKSMYMHLINDAKETVYITAPYLILDNEVATALKLSSLSGVDVKIIVPSIPDKKLVYMVSESYIEELVKYGVKVYQFLPGFIHSKMIICDKKVAMIGSSNLDFRSLYMHLENNLWLNDQKTIDEMVKYYEDTLNESKLMTAESLKKRNIVYRIIQAILRGFAPLL